MPSDTHVPGQCYVSTLAVSGNVSSYSCQESSTSTPDGTGVARYWLHSACRGVTAVATRDFTEMLTGRLS